MSEIKLIDFQVITVANGVMLSMLIPDYGRMPDPSRMFVFSTMEDLAIWLTKQPWGPAKQICNS